MSADPLSARGVSAGLLSDPRQVRILRYAVGATLALATAMAIDWPLAYMAAVLALSFLASPDPCPTLRQGMSFVAVVAMATIVGLLLSSWLLAYPLVYVPFVGLVLFRIFYAKARGRSPILIQWLLIAVLVLPLVAILSPDVAEIVAASLVVTSAATILLVWLTYFFFPDPAATVPTPTAAPGAQVVEPQAAFVTARDTTVVVLPIFVLFYTLQLTGSILVLIFIAMLSAQPGFARNFKAGAALILGNVLGGLVAIALYDILVMLPSYGFLVMLTFACALLFAQRLFSGDKLAPIFGMAFSTVLLVIGSTTSGNADAGGKVLSRVVQILIAVVYVVVAFGVLERFHARREARRA